jgi:hypothetical protein
MLTTLCYTNIFFKLKIPYNRGCAKMTKSDIYNSEQSKLSKPQNLSDLVILYIYINFQISLKL